MSIAKSLKEFCIMRGHKIKRLYMIGISTVSILLFYRVLIWQFQMQSIFPVIINSSHRSSFTHWKHTFFGALAIAEESCFASKSVYERINQTRDEIQVTSGRIDLLLRESGLQLEHAYVSRTEALFTSEAIMMSQLPHFKARIPALVFHKNVFLAFCEARFEGVHDFGQMMIAMRRGILHNGEITWETIQLIAGIRAFRTMNPSPIVDIVNDAIVLIFAGFPSSMSFEEMMSFPTFPLSKLFVITSYDLGQTWTDPTDITAQTILQIHPNPVLLVPGPGHSIQLKCGRLIVPINYFTQDENSVHIPQMCRNCTNYNRILYSDNGGTDWSVGSRSRFTKDRRSIPIYLNEVQAVEVDDNAICLNSRTLQATHPRAITRSLDGGKTLLRTSLSGKLIEPGYRKDGSPNPSAGCAGSVIGFDAPISKTSKRRNSQSRWVIFSNPANAASRVHLSIRLSIDGCRTWSPPWRIHSSKAAYSDLTFFEHHFNGRSQLMVAVFYEAGYDNPLEALYFKMFNLEALLSGVKSEVSDLKR